MRIALLTEGGYPYARGESVVWCDRLLRGLEGHRFEVYALSRSVRQEDAGWCELPSNVELVRTAPLWGAAAEDARAASAGPYGRRERRRFRTHFAELAEAFCATGTDEGRPAQADRFSAGLHGLADLARECGGLPAALRSETAVRLLEAACRAPGALRAAHAARVADLLEVADRLERALRPLSLEWYGAAPGGGLATADLCHAVGGGPAALPGLLAKRWFGTPLLITEYGVRLREHYLASAADAVAPAAAGAPVRALLASFQGLLTRESYTQAQLITPGTSHARRWQERCGARRERLRTVYPGMDTAPFDEIGEETARATGPSAPAGGAEGPAAAGPALVWVGRIEPGKDLIGLLHAFAEIRRAEPSARLRIVAAVPGRGPEDEAYAAHCRVLAEQLFPGEAVDVDEADEADEAPAAGANPVTFAELGGHDVPTLADAYAAAGVVVLSSVVEGFPVSLVQAMFCGRATVSTDAGAVCEVIGGTGLVVSSSDPRALADACTALLRDPARRARLGAAARARALELFTVEQNIEAFRDIYLELLSHSPGGHGSAAAPGEGRPRAFARPAESHVPGRWAGSVRAAATTTADGQRAGTPGPSWSRPDAGAGTGAAARAGARAGTGGVG